MFILPAASLIRKKAFDEVGGFDEKLVGYEDDDLFLRMFIAGWESAFVPESLSFWRMHGKNTIISTHMINSRRKYADKLMAAYPDSPASNVFWVRDCIAPRFFDLNMSQYNGAC
jgi:GT2 family glycosyltransferase